MQTQMAALRQDISSQNAKAPMKKTTVPVKKQMTPNSRPTPLLDRFNQYQQSKGLKRQRVNSDSSDNEPIITPQVNTLPQNPPIVPTDNNVNSIEQRQQSLENNLNNINNAVNSIAEHIANLSRQASPVPQDQEFEFENEYDGEYDENYDDDTNVAAEDMETEPF
jgi:hypothetical protein